MNFDLILKNGTCVTPNGIGAVDVGIVSGKIAALGNFHAAQAGKTIDCTGLHILPGIIDTQVHFREPGLDHKEDLHTGSRAAVLGGVTAVFEMPNTKPLTTSPETHADKMQRAAGRMYCDYAFFMGGTAQNADHLRDWENLPGVCGIKIFMGSSTGDLLVADDNDIRRILGNGRRTVSVHSEDEAMMLSNKVRMLADNPHPPVTMHPVWRSVESCVSSTTRLLRLARETGRHVHVLHICTADELPILAAHRDVATCEVLPNHLSFAAPDCYERLGTKTQQNPPIREQHHQDALWNAVRSGLIDILGSDHAPHTLEEKAKPYPDSPSGAPCVQALVPVMLTHVANGKLTLERFVDLTATGPQRVFGIAGKGRIAAGFDADFCIVDLQKQHVIKDADQGSKAGWTPYDGQTCTGRVVNTIVRGQLVVADGQVVDTKPTGDAVRFWS